MTSSLPTSPYRRGVLIRSRPFRDLRFRIFLKDQPNRPGCLAEIGSEADLCRRAAAQTSTHRLDGEPQAWKLSVRMRSVPRGAGSAASTDTLRASTSSAAVMPPSFCEHVGLARFT